MATDPIPTSISNGDAYPPHLPPQRSYQVVVAATKDMGIGRAGELAWKLPSDVKFFKAITSSTCDSGKRNAVIMGRKTWQSIPFQYRPLPGRLNVLLTRSRNSDIDSLNDMLVCDSLSASLELLASSPYCSTIEKVFVIGGGETLREALNAPRCEAIHITEIETRIDCDTFIPSIDPFLFHPWYSSFPMVENSIRFYFTTYVRIRHSSEDSHVRANNQANGSVTARNSIEVTDFSFLPKIVLSRHEEFMYLRLVDDILQNGDSKEDRTGIGTLSKFGCQMRFNLRRTFPLLTTKKVFWHGVVEELLWFISGSTNAKVLQQKGVRIWDGNSSREFLDRNGFKKREEGDLGPIYGFQWRHFGAKYKDMYTDYTGQGIDQLSDVISKIKNNPNDRRIILTAWNPLDVKEISLPPCHMFAQFYVNNGELSCQMYQRSADVGLGVPFNVASYALLTRMIAQVCDLVPGDFIHVIGDAHVYKTHITPLKQQLQNLPRPFPILKINPEKKDIDSFVESDFELFSYKPHPKIEMEMAV